MIARFNHAPEYDGTQSAAVILGVPYDSANTTVGGQADAPYAIRTIGGWDWDEMYDPSTGAKIDKGTVRDAGDVPPSKTMRRTGKRVAERVRDILPTTRLLVVLGGDNSISRMVLGGMDKPYLVLFDAHSDLWGPEGDEPHDHGTWVRDAIEEGLVSGVSIVGHRCLGPLPEVWDRYGVHDIPMRKYRQSPSESLWDIIGKAGDQPVYLAIDIDVVDPAFAPATGNPEPGGMASWDILDATQTLVKALDVVAMDVTEVIPELDSDTFPTCALANRIVIEALLANSVR